MSEFASEGDAVAALQAAVTADAQASSSAPAEQATPPADTTPNAVDQGTNLSEESFTNIDINSLPPELRPLVETKYKEFQADYTRKTQEIAPIRKLMEETGLGVEDAREALQFVQRLSDPEVQRELYTRLSAQFEGDPAAEEDPNVDPRDKQLAELSGRLERFEQEQARNAARIELAQAENEIKAANPSFKDEDMSRIRRLGLSFNGDLKAAATEYASWQQSVLSGYVASKASSAAAPGTPPAGTHAQTPLTFSSLDEAHKAALARYANEF